MKKQTLLILLLASCSVFFAQVRPANKLTLQKTYYMSQISQTLRDYVDKHEKTAYFNDAFFNERLKEIVLNKSFSDKEKAQLFYLMQKKIGFAFVGSDYIPPAQSYFTHHSGKLYLMQATKKILKDLNYNVSGLLRLADSTLKIDNILSGNALLLASLLNTDKITKKLETYTKPTVILGAKNPEIFNHYVCMSASISQNSVVAANLNQSLLTFKREGMLEDVFCALYSRDNFVSIMKHYILAEKNPENELAIQTALCALAAKVPVASYKKSIETLIKESKEEWKTKMCQDLLDNKIPYNYGLSSAENFVNKLWDGVTETQYADGTMILNGVLMEFDPNN